MNECRGLETPRRHATWVAGLVVLGLAWGHATAEPVWGQRPPTDGHVAEASAYLDRVQIAEPVAYGNLAVYPVLLTQKFDLPGRWLCLDEALSRGSLVIREKGAGSVPVVVADNRSRDEYVFIMTGEVISGGRQTRTVRREVVLAPGQQVDLEVLCVEAHRWEGGKEFAAGRVILPQSIQGELRRGADQSKVWSEVARNNSALKSENATGSLELALKTPAVREKLAALRQHVLPRIPMGTMGFIFVDRHRAVGADFFGSERLARELLPKLLDSYGVDYVILRYGGEPDRAAARSDRQAIDLYERICRAGSRRSGTPGSGAGIHTRSDGLLGDGVSVRGTLVHFGVQ